MIKEILIFFGSSAILIAGLGFLLRNIIIHYLNRDFKQFEQRLLNEAQKNNFIFENLYVRKLEAIALLYEQSILAEQATRYAVSMHGNISPEKIPELEEKIKSFKDRYQLARLWLDDESCEIIDKLLDHHTMFYKVINGATLQKNGLGKDWLGKEFLKLWEKAEDELPKVQNQLRDSFIKATKDIKP